jgi:avirulence D protein (AvrD)
VLNGPPQEDAVTNAGSIDDHLGAATGRFFGEGFKRIGHRVENVRIDGRTIAAAADLYYPGDWSRKAGGGQRPHLSSVDALILATQLAEAHLTHTRGLTPAMRRTMRLLSFEMRGGGVPQEELAALGIGAQLSTEQDGSSTYSCRIGTIAVTCEIAHGPAPRFAAAGSYRTLADVLGSPASRYYGDGYRRRSQRISSVRVAADGRSIAAMVDLSSPHPSDAGLGGAFEPAASMVDALVCLAQLAQVLAYRLDGIDRGSSRTLWMRRLRQVSPAPHAARRPMRAALALTRTSLVPLDGAVWRTLDVAGAFGGIDVRSSIAHELPAEARLAA